MVASLPFQDITWSSKNRMKVVISGLGRGTRMSYVFALLNVFIAFLSGPACFSGDRYPHAKMHISLILSLTLSAVCLVTARPITSSEIANNSAKGLRLISFAEGVEPVWKTEADVFALINQKNHFVSIFIPIL
jgi:hypothetical protein